MLSCVDSAVSVRETIPADVGGSGLSETFENFIHSQNYLEMVNYLAQTHELSVLKEFFSKCAAHSSALLIEASKKSAAVSSEAAGDVYLKIENVQLIEPRGRFDISIGEGGILVQGKVGRTQL